MPSVLQSVKNAFTPRQPAEPGIVDHAENWAQRTAADIRQWIGERSPWTGHRIDEVAAVAAEMDRQGYTKHVKEFNSKLTRPLTSGYSEVQQEVRAAATFASSQSTATSFAVWNVLCFWLNLALLLLGGLLTWHVSMVEVFRAALGYATAYSFHFIFLKAPRKRWMLVCIIWLVLYVGFEVFAGVATSILIIPAIFSFVRATANGILTVYAFQLYSQVAEEGAATML